MVTAIAAVSRGTCRRGAAGFIFDRPVRPDGGHARPARGGRLDLNVVPAIRRLRAARRHHGRRTRYEQAEEFIAAMRALSRPEPVDFQRAPHAQARDRRARSVGAGPRVFRGRRVAPRAPVRRRGADVYLPWVEPLDDIAALIGMLPRRVRGEGARARGSGSARTSSSGRPRTRRGTRPGADVAGRRGGLAAAGRVRGDADGRAAAQLRAELRERAPACGTGSPGPREPRDGDRRRSRAGGGRAPRLLEARDRRGCAASLSPASLTRRSAGAWRRTLNCPLRRAIDRARQFPASCALGSAYPGDPASASTSPQQLQALGVTHCRCRGT